MQPQLGDLRYLGEYQAARELDQDTPARKRRVLGEDHPSTRRSGSILAADLHALGKPIHPKLCLLKKFGGTALLRSEYSPDFGSGSFTCECARELGFR